MAVVHRATYPEFRKGLPYPQCGAGSWGRNTTLTTAPTLVTCKRCLAGAGLSANRPFAPLESA